MIYFLFIAGLFAGFIDAIAGGSGLIMVPAYILAGIPAPTSIATNKLCNVVGSLVSGWRYYTFGDLKSRILIRLGGPALFGACLGAFTLPLVSPKFMEPIVAILILGVTLLLLFRPKLGLQPADNTRAARPMAFILGGLAIGFHDGFFGPGAGILFTTFLIVFGRLTFLEATGTSKAINFLTSLLALLIFLYQDKVNIPMGIAGALGIGVGSYFGAHYAKSRGAPFVRYLFLLMSMVVIGKLAWGYSF